MIEYQRLLKYGYKPIKTYTRFVLMENKIGLKRCVLWVDIDKLTKNHIKELLNERNKKDIV